MSKGKVFTAPEVQAIISGNKKMFREVIKVQPDNARQQFSTIECSTNRSKIGKHIFIEIENQNYITNRTKPFKCPYQVGQKIFCKESFVKFQPIHYMRYPSGASFSEVFDGEIAYFADGYGTVAEFKKHYMACNNFSELAQSNGLEAVETDGDRWKPASQMKKEHSRLTLQIKEIRVERLADIIEEDAIAEAPQYSIIQPFGNKCPIDFFKTLWNAIHKKPEEKFEANPFVWAIQFEVVK